MVTSATHVLPSLVGSDREAGLSVNGLGWAFRLAGNGVLGQLSSQQVARRNAATAAALMLRRRQEREDVEAFLAQRLDQRPDRHVGSGTRAGTAS